MSNFRTRLLGLAAVATAFTGMSYGQIGPAGVCLFSGINTPNPTLRAEGETELVEDISTGGTCTNSGAATTGTVYVTLSAPVTSKAVTIGVTASNEATLLVNGASPVQGVVTGFQVAFPNIAIPAGAFTLTVSNIRVNASASAAPQVTESAVLSYANGATSTNLALASGLNVGYVLTSLGATSLLPGGGVASYLACAGNVAANPNVAPSTSFTVQVKELVGGAFKVNGPASQTVNIGGGNTQEPGEGGSYVPNANGIGVSNTATEINIALGNLPSGSTVYLPQFTCVGSNFAITCMQILNSTGISTGPLAGNVSFTPTGGALTVTYSVYYALAVGAQTFNIPVIVSFPGNTVTATVPPTAITVAATYAPSGTVTGPATAVPTFVVSTAPVVNATTITACTTTLLFPYVTNAAGFETGMAISNTTTDNLYTGPAPGRTSQATPTSGVCTLNFYGSLTQPPAVTSSTIGAYSATQSPVYSNVLTSLIGESGFTGYAIASCNFLDAHGFAFITDATGTFSGAMGYLASVIPSSRTENSDTSSVSLSGTVNLTTGAFSASGSTTGTGFVGQ